MLTRCSCCATALEGRMDHLCRDCRREYQRSHRMPPQRRPIDHAKIQAALERLELAELRRELYELLATY